MGKLVGAWSKDYMRRVIISLVAIAIVLPLGCCFIFLPLSLVQGGSFSDATTILVLIVPMALFFIVVIGGALGGGYWIISRRTHWLDEALLPLGLEGKSYGLSGRQYHGRYQGRQVDILVYRGPTVSINVGTPLKTRLSVAERNRTGLAISRAFKREPLETADPDLASLVVYAHEESWGQALITQSEAKTIFNRLVLGESNFLFQQLHLNPEAFLYRLYRSKGLFKFHIQPEQFQSWLNDVISLAQLAEALPVPQEAIEPSRLEQGARTGEAGKWGLWIGVGIVAFLCVLSIVPLALGLLLALASG
jgi:hypothetical protein